MTILLTIAACLLGSALLQGVGFYLYSAIYKKKNANLHISIANLPADAAADQGLFSPTHQPVGQKTFNTNNPYAVALSVKDRVTGATYNNGVY